MGDDAPAKKIDARIEVMLDLSRMCGTVKLVRLHPMCTDFSLAAHRLFTGLHGVSSRAYLWRGFGVRQVGTPMLMYH